MTSADAGPPTSLGAYHLGRVLGRGAMAEVWEVTRAALPLAVKRMRGDDERFRSALAAEVRAVARLHHPGVVAVYDHGEDDGRSWFAMERADGTLEQAPPTNWPDVADLLRQLLAGLAHTHARGLVHRDIKASNVLRFDGARGCPRWALADFGLVFAVGGGDRSSLAWGTPTSMAPEQFDGRWHDFGPPTDLYALGCLAWRLVHGRHPFPSTDPRALAVAHRTAPLPPFAPMAAVPEGLGTWIATLLAKHPSDRFQRAADAAFALAALGRADTRIVPMVHSEDVTWSTMTPGPPTPEMPAPAASTSAARTRPAADVEEALGSAPPEPLPVGALGLSLMGLREIPTVARLEERRWLWSELLQARAEGRPRVVVLRGDMGTGRHHLARWIATRADELGAAMGIEGGDSVHDLGKALLRAQGLPADALAAHIDAELRGLPLSADDRMVARRWWGVEGQPPPAGEAAALLATVLAARASARGLVVVIDRPDPALLRFVRTAPAAPVLWVVIDAEVPGASRIELEPLGPGAQARALEVLLPLSHDLAAELVQRSGGHLAHARGLLARWADAGLLEPTPKGYVLRPGAAPPTSSGSHPLDPDLSEAAALAALLGPEVDRRVWIDACAPLPLTRLVALEASLAEIGAVRVGPDSWRWIRPEVREALLPSTGAEPLHRRLADALGRGVPTARNLGRQGRHLALAGQAAEADQKLLRGAAAAHEAGAFHEVLALLTLVSDPGHPSVAWRRALALLMLGDLDGADAAAREGLERARGPDRAAAWRALGGVAARRGDRERATLCFREALSVPELGDHQQAHATTELAGNLVTLGRLSEALAVLEVPVERPTMASLAFDVVRGRALIQAGEVQLARAVLDGAVADATTLHARTWQAIARVDLAMALHLLDRDDDAREAYRLAIDGFEGIANHGAAATARLGLGGLDALSGRHEVALDLLDGVVARLVAEGLEPMASAAHAARLVALAGQGAWDRFDETLAAVIAVPPPPIPFVTEVLHAAASAAMGAGEADRARRIRDLPSATPREGT